MLSLVIDNLAQAQRKGALSASDSVVTAVRNDSTINIGYGMQNKRIISSAISTVKGENLEKGFRLNLGSTLFGQLAGITVQQGGSEPGASAPTLYGRGRNTFSGPGGSDQPLVIIDGFLSGGSGAGSGFMQLVPEEVESISFLKDASATAVYGSRGANGVILVTTKRGAVAPLQVGFSTRQGFSQGQFIPRVLNSYDYATLYNEALTNDKLPIKYQPADLAAYRDNTDPYGHPNVDWYSQIFRSAAPVSSYDLTFRGGDKSTKYFVLLNALTNQGLYKKFGDINEVSSNSNYKKYNFRTNLDISLSNSLSVAFSIGGSVEQKTNPFSYNTTNATTASLSELDLISRLPPNAFPVYNPNGTYSGSSAYGASGVNSNPLGNLLETGNYQNNSRTIQSSLRFTEKLDVITPGLSISGAVSLNNYYNAGTQRSKNYAIYSLAASQIKGAPFGLATALVSAETNIDQYRNLIIQGDLNYKRSFGKSAVAATAIIYTDNVSLKGNNTGNSTDPYIHNGGAGRFTYVYDDRYIAEFSGGVTGSSNFPSGGRYGFFPAGSVGWVISNETFLKGNKALNFFKLRASYGLAGNDNIGSFNNGRYVFTQTYTQTGTSGGYFFGTGNTAAQGYAEGVLANPNVTWEKEKSVNIGADATVFNSFDLSVDVFNRDRYDIAVPLALPQYFGILAPYYNVGKSNNKGLDATVQYKSNINHKFQYTLGTNFSYALSKVLFNGESVQLNTNLYNSGYQIGQPYRLRAIGFWTQEDIDKRAANPLAYAAPSSGAPRAGDLRYQDIGGPKGVPDGVIDGNDNIATTNTTLPKITMGLHTAFSYKGFDLDALFQAVTGVSTYLGGSYFNAFQNNGPVTAIALGRWTPETAAAATYPRLSTLATSIANNALGSTFYERDGSFIKLRSAELGYTIPLSLSSRIKLKSARLFVTGTNLFSLDHVPYGDPESVGGYPVLRTYTLGVKVQL